MVDHKHDPPGRGAGWVVAAIVAVVAVCAISFMITQRPQEAMAVAEGDPITDDMRRPARPAPPSAADGAPQAVGVDPLAANRAGARSAASAQAAADSASAIPSRVVDANAAASNASALESTR